MAIGQRPGSHLADARIRVTTKCTRKSVRRYLIVGVFGQTPRRNFAQTRTRIGCKDAGKQNRTLIAILTRFSTTLTQHLDQRVGRGRSALLNRMLDDLREGFFDAIGMRGYAGLRVLTRD